MDIDDIVNQALTRLNQEQELRRLAILELLYKNIDILINNSAGWFGNEVPDEFKRVLRSFVAISTSFLSEENDYRDMIFDDVSEKIFIVELLKVILNDLEKLFDRNIFTFNYDDETITVLTSHSKLKKSLSSIFLSFMVFMDKNSICKVAVSDDISNVNIQLSFSNLTASYPGIDMMQRAFFYYTVDNDYRIGMGIDFALYRLRNIGAIVKVKKTGFDPNSVLINISFPSENFQEVVEEIRKSNPEEFSIKNKGTIYILTADFIIGMVVAELLHNKGYTLLNVEFNNINESTIEQSKVLIIDFSYILEKSIETISFSQVAKYFSRVLLIHSEEDKKKIAPFAGDNVVTLEKPLDMERIILEVEKEYLE